MKNSKQMLPRGLKDISPTEAKELNQIKKKLLKSFGLWGYSQVQTPTFEYYEALASLSGELIEKEMFKLFDSDGELLALKPEMTTPIARMAAQKFTKSPLPLRFSYVSKVFRQELPRRGQMRQFTQGGVELIGESGPLADAEVICICIDSLKNIGLTDFVIGIGRMDVIEGIIEKFNSPDAAFLKEALLNKDFSSMKKFQDTGGGPRKAIKALIQALNCNTENDLKDLSKTDIPQKAKNGIEELLRTLRLIKKYGFADKVKPDLALIGNFDYYTGAVFEIYIKGLGFPVGSGGRYDGLLVKFGKNLPAAGFAIGLERLHIALNENKVRLNIKEKNAVIFGEDDRKVFLKSSKLREAGYNVATLSGVNSRQAVSYANEFGFQTILELKKDTLFTVLPDGRRGARWKG